jgi:hypothetical protein
MEFVEAFARVAEKLSPVPLHGKILFNYDVIWLIMM